ncbi:hypothetical protein ACT8ZV_13335 [Nocardioides sp. MAHUQ-72]|uniref:hypothetical protein n=1 Tax=unclassified Nocardioides TaxID=2615069 RepID=UPI003620FCC0
MRPRLLAATLTISLAALGACSTDDDSAEAWPTPSSSGAALRTKDDGGQFTLCLPVTAKDGDFAWTGMRIHADADATVVDFGPDSGADRVAQAWVVEAEHASGNLALWSSAVYRKGLDWAHRMPIDDASLEAGKTYRVVVRIHPDLAALPNEVGSFQLAYESAGDSGTLRNDTVVQLTKHC